jgi:hypothetical protein
MVDRLERNGYVRREVDASDRRRLIIQPLPERLASIAPHCQGMATAWKDLLAAYDDEQLALFLDLLTACIGCPSTSSQTLATTQIRHGNRQQMTLARRKVALSLPVAVGLLGWTSMTAGLLRGMT